MTHTTAVQKRAAQVPAEPTRDVPIYTPACDILETPEGLVILADMPGVAESGVELHLEDDVLTLRGRCEERPDPQGELASCEFHPGDYFRRFQLSEQLDQSRIQATLKDAVLRVLLPKTERARPKKIAVKVN